MRSALKNIRHNGDHRIAFIYEDGLTAELHFENQAFFENAGTILQELRQETAFSQAYLDHGALTWPNGYDICPDILRLWCEKGRILTRNESDLCFGSSASDHEDLALAG